MVLTIYKLLIIGISSVITIGLILYLLNSYDFTPSTMENPYGVDARVLVQPTYFSPGIQTESSNFPQNVLWFRYNSKEPIDLIGYTICNGIFCIKAETYSYSPPAPEWKDFPEMWAGNTLGDLHWKVGDSVHIWIKVSPVEITETGERMSLSEPVFYIDLGESKIIQGPIERI
jgi:hypothetical protein